MLIYLLSCLIIVIATAIQIGSIKLAANACCSLVTHSLYMIATILVMITLVPRQIETKNHAS